MRARDERRSVGNALKHGEEKEKGEKESGERHTRGWRITIR